MTNEEVVERVRKALYASTHALDETQAEIAIRGVGRMLAANLRQFNQVFAPFEPSSRTVETTRLMGEQIVQLTRERGELQVTVARQEATIARLEATVSELTLKLAAPQRQPALVEQREQMPPRRNPPPIKLKLGVSHRMILKYVVESGGSATMRELYEVFTANWSGLPPRLSELSRGKHFGGVAITRTPGQRGNPRFDITPYGRALLAEDTEATYDPDDQPTDEGGDDDCG